MGVGNTQGNLKEEGKRLLKEKDSNEDTWFQKPSTLEERSSIKKDIEFTNINIEKDLYSTSRHKRKVNFVEAQKEEKAKRLSNKEAVCGVEGDLYKSSEELFFMLKLENEDSESTMSSLEKVSDISRFTLNGRKRVSEFLLRMICSCETKSQDRIYYFCDREKIPDQKSPNFGLFGRAFAMLEKIFIRENKTTENVQFLSSRDVTKCLYLLKSEDLRIRTLTKRFIQEIYNRCTEMRHCIKTKVKNILVNVVHEQVEPVGINEALNLCTYILVSEGFGDASEAHCYFLECVFPVLKIHNAHLYEQELKTAFEAFSQLGNECFLYIFKHLSKVFSEVNSNVRTSILNFCLSIVQVKQTTMDFNTIEGHVCKIISTCLRNAHCILISHVLTFIKEKVIYNFLKLNCKTFIPKIFDDVYDLSKNYWNKDRSPEVYAIVTVIMSLDKNIFEECLKKYNFKKYKQKIEEDLSEDVVKCFGQDLLRENEGVFGIRRKSLPHEEKKS